MEGLLVLGWMSMGGSSQYAENLLMLSANHVEPKSAVHRSIQCGRRCTLEGAQYFGNAGQKENCQTLTQSEVLDFVGWSPFCTCEEFDQYRLEHPEL